MSDATLRALERAWNSSGALSDHAALFRERQRQGMDLDFSSPDEIHPRFDDYDWEEVWKYATPHQCEAGHDHGPSPAVPLTQVDTAEFSREDVKRVIAAEDGMNDADDWIAVVELWDGRFASISAGCDYTGWG